MKLRLRSEGHEEPSFVSIFPRAALRALTVVALPILVLAPFAAIGSRAPHFRPPNAVQQLGPSSRLSAGSTLREGSSLTSPNGLYRLGMETNGDLVLSWKGRPLWSSRTSGHAGAVADMQGDGNFVIYAGHRAVWSSATGGHTHSAFYLAVRNDGNVVIYTSANELIWASGTLVSRTKAVHRSLRRPSHRPAA